MSKSSIGDAIKLTGKSMDEVAAAAKSLRDQAESAAKAAGGAPISSISQGLFKQTDEIVATGSKQLDDWLKSPAGAGASRNSPLYKQMEATIAHNTEVALNKAAKQLAKEADEAAAAAAKQTADAVAKEATEKAAKEAAEKTTKEAAEKATDDALAATAKASADAAKVAAKAADDAAEAATKAADDAAKLAAKAADDAAKAAKTTDEAVKAAAKASEDAAKAAKKAADDATKAADDAAKAAAEKTAKASDDAAVIIKKEGDKIDDVAENAGSAAAKGAKTADEIAEAAAKRADAIKKAKMAVAAGIGGGIAAASLANYLKKDKKEFNIITIEDVTDATGAKDASSNIIYKTMITIQVDGELSKKASIKIEDTDCVPIIPVEEYDIEDIIANKKITIITPVKITTPGKKGKMTYYTTFQKELELVLKDVADNTVKAGTAAVINTAVETGKDIGKDTLKSAGLGDILDKGLGEFFGKGFDQILGMVGLTRETFYYILGGLAVLFVLYVLYNISRIFI